MMRVAGLQAFIIRFALRFRAIIVVLACLLVAYGIYVLGNASYDAFPEFAPPQVDVQTEAPGFASEQVETLVTRALEVGDQRRSQPAADNVEFDPGLVRHQGLF